MANEIQMEHPIISIIIPVHNTAKYLRRCLDSILGQIYTNLDIILVDDGSEDGSEGICRAYEASDNRVRFFRQEPGGPGKARNEGMKRARGTLISYVDSDDWIADTMYTFLVAQLQEKEADIAIVTHKITDVEVLEEPKQPQKIEIWDTKTAIEQLVRDQKTGSFAWGKLYRRALFEEFAFPEDMLYEDTACIYQLFLKARKVVWAEYPLYYYFQNHEGILHSRTLQLNLDQYKAYQYQTQDIIGIWPELREEIYQRNLNFMITTYCYYLKEYQLEPCYTEGMKEMREELKKTYQFLQKNRKVPFGSRTRIWLILYGSFLYARLLQIKG